LYAVKILDGIIFISPTTGTHTLSGTHAKKQLNLYEIAHVQLRAWSAGLQQRKQYPLPTRTAINNSARFEFTVREYRIAYCCCGEQKK